jgi:hypothetical protein
MSPPDGSGTTAKVWPASLLRHNFPLVANTRLGAEGSNAMLLAVRIRYSLTSDQLLLPFEVRYRPRGVLTTVTWEFVG